MKAPGGLQAARGFHTTRGRKQAHLRVPADRTPPKFHEKTPTEREKKERKWERERKTKRESLGGPAQQNGVRGKGGPGHKGVREREGEQEVGRGSGAGEGRRRVGRLGCLQGGTSTGP